MIDYLSAVPAVGEMVDDIERFVTRWLPAYAADSRSYLTVAIGCTGGQHRYGLLRGGARAPPAHRRAPSSSGIARWRG